jgi:ATP phosphoribosyltransferase
MISWGVKRYRDLQTDPEAIQAIHEAHKTKAGQAELITATMYEKEASEEGEEAPKQIPTIATEYLKAAFAYLDKSKALANSLDDFSKRIDSIGKPPAK